MGTRLYRARAVWASPEVMVDRVGKNISVKKFLPFSLYIYLEGAPSIHVRVRLQISFSYTMPASLVGDADVGIRRIF